MAQNLTKAQLQEQLDKLQKEMETLKTKNQAMERDLTEKDAQLDAKTMEPDPNANTRPVVASLRNTAKIRSFSGSSAESQTYAEWITHARRCAKLNRWSTEEAFARAVIMLTG